MIVVSPTGVGVSPGGPHIPDRSRRLAMAGLIEPLAAALARVIGSSAERSDSAPTSLELPHVPDLSVPAGERPERLGVRREVQS